MKKPKSSQSDMHKMEVAFRQLKRMMEDAKKNPSIDKTRSLSRARSQYNAVKKKTGSTSMPKVATKPSKYKKK